MIYGVHNEPTTMENSSLQENPSAVANNDLHPTPSLPQLPPQVSGSDSLGIESLQD